MLIDTKVLHDLNWIKNQDFHFVLVVVVIYVAHGFPILPSRTNSIAEYLSFHIGLALKMCVPSFMSPGHLSA